ncbi:MAG: tol-pal system-associated acyl-CoA thioesterase [Pseudomonadota bacterium]
MTHSFPVTVYYEDTDMGGIVYYANYLKFIERARSTWVAELGVDQLAMKDAGIVFAVRRVEADYLAPARLGDELVVQTVVTGATPARWVLNQQVSRDGTVLFEAIVTIVAIGDGGQPVRLPAELRQFGPARTH